tara:strand:- start:71973 stop:72770 length:798 start_codon:yes stop_codon:yes gene_type:complete
MIKKIIALFLGIYIVLMVIFYLVQERIIFQSKKLDTNFTYTFAKKFEEVQFTTSDKAVISALHFKVDNPKGVLLYFHGNKGNLQRWGTMVSPYTQYNYDVFVIDYRGYGKSTGKRSEQALYNDAEEAYKYLNTQLGYAESEIVVYGRSLGCTFASYVASKNKPRHLILEAPFNSLIGVIKSKFPLFPYQLLLKYPFKTYALLPKVTSPTVIFHGDKDRLIAIDSGKKLFEVSNKEWTTFVTIKNGTHHNLTTFEIYKATMKAILE